LELNHTKARTIKFGLTTHAPSIAGRAHVLRAAPSQAQCHRARRCAQHQSPRFPLSRPSQVQDGAPEFAPNCPFRARSSWPSGNGVIGRAPLLSPAPGQASQYPCGAQPDTLRARAAKTGVLAQATRRGCTARISELDGTSATRARAAEGGAGSDWPTRHGALAVRSAGPRTGRCWATHPHDCPRTALLKETKHRRFSATSSRPAPQGPRPPDAVRPTSSKELDRTTCGLRVPFLARQAGQKAGLPAGRNRGVRAISADITARPGTAKAAGWHPRAARLLDQSVICGWYSWGKNHAARHAR
jgi:hypothetical protein